MSAVDMSVIWRIVPECSRIARHFYLGKVIEQLSRSYVVHGVQCINHCHNMASSGIELDTGERKDNLRKSLEADDQISAKRLKTCDSSLENDVGVTCIFFALICLQ